MDVPVGLLAAAALVPVRAQPVQAELEAFPGGRRDQHRRRVDGGDEMPVAGIARVRHQDLVARLEQREAGQLQRGGRARGDDDAIGIEGQVLRLAVPVGDALTQRPQSVGLRVGDATLGGEARGGVADGRAGAEVRLADVQVDHAPAAPGRIADRRAGDLIGPFGAFHDIERIDVPDTIRKSHARHHRVSVLRSAARSASGSRTQARWGLMRSWRDPETTRRPP